VSKYVTQERRDEEEEEQRVTNETSCILLRVPKTAYKKKATEYRKCRDKVMAGD